MTLSNMDWCEDGDFDVLAAQKRRPAFGAHRRLTARLGQKLHCANTDVSPDQVQLPLAFGSAPLPCDTLQAPAPDCAASDKTSKARAGQ